MQLSLQQRIIRSIAVVIVLIVTLIGAMQAKERVVRRIASGPNAFEANDFDRWMQMLPEFLAGRQNYVNDRFPTPPITIVILAPFTLLSPPMAQFVWACCKPLLACAIFWFIKGMLHQVGTRFSPLALGLVLASWFWPMIGDLQEGQMNLLMLLPLSAGLWLAQRETAKSDWVAGVLIGLAICIKVTPVIFLIYFLWRRRWRLSAATLSGIALFLLIVPAFIFGVQQNMVWLEGWGQQMIVPYVVRGAVMYPNGESIASMITRFLQHVPAFHLAGTHGTGIYYANVMNLSDQAVGWIVRGILGGILLVGLLWMRRPLLTLRCQRYIGEIGAVGAFMLWASERTWVAHYVTLILPLCGAAMVASYGEFSARIRKTAYGVLVFSAIMMLLTSDVAKWIFGPNGREMAMMVNVPLWASAALVWTLMWVGLPDRPLFDMSGTIQSGRREKKQQAEQPLPTPSILGPHPQS